MMAFVNEMTNTIEEEICPRGAATSMSGFATSNLDLIAQAIINITTRISEYSLRLAGPGGKYRRSYL